MMQILKQAKKMQSEFKKKQKLIKKQKFQGTSGGGMVIVEVNGEPKLLDIKIEPSLLDKTKATMLEQLILSAVNDALNHAQAAAQDIIRDMAPSINLDDIKDMFSK